jgi:hypothetical protein
MERRREMICAVVVAVGAENANAVESRSRRLEARWTALPKLENHFKFVSRDLLPHQTQLS